MVWKYRLFKVFNEHIHFHNIFINQIYQALFVLILNCFLCRDLFSSLFLCSSTRYLFHLLFSSLAFLFPHSSLLFLLNEGANSVSNSFSGPIRLFIRAKKSFLQQIPFFFQPKRQQLLETFYFCKCKLLDISLDFCKSFLFEDFFALNKYKFILFVFIVLFCVLRCVVLIVYSLWLQLKIIFCIFHFIVVYFFLSLSLWFSHLQKRINFLKMVAKKKL